MSSHDSTNGPGTALARCVGDVDAFRDELWGLRSLVRPPAQAGESAFSDLMTLADVDTLITGTSLRTPLFRLVRSGTPLPLRDYTRSATIGGVRMDGIADAPAVLDAMDDGATLVLQGLQRYWPPLTRFVRELELELGHPCQVNAYITPPGAQGLNVHSDPHDVFVLQVFGSKQWEIHPAPGEEPGPAQDTVLTPGTTQYLPKGTPHAARAQDTLSFHLTIGILVSTWREVLDSALARFAATGELDTRLPVGYQADRDGFATLVGEQLGQITRALDKVDATELADEVVDRFSTTRPRPLIGGLLDRVALAQLTDDTVLRRRHGAEAVLRPGPDGKVRLLLGDRELQLPGRTTPVLEIVAARQTLRPSDLVPLSPTSRLVLARRLIREGLLEVSRAD